ncbi:MAG: hypothetical protein AB7I18_10025 [Candidatus Berkiella sp.]
MALAGAKQLLSILTGQTPEITTGSYDKLHRGEHVRFSFERQGASFNFVKTFLKILDIQHCSELYKHVEPRQGPVQLAFYITLGPQACQELMSYVAPGAMLTNKAKEKVFNVDVSPQMQAALLKILFDKSFFEQITDRNQNSYNLDGIMFYLAQVMMNTAPCFSHLLAKGIKRSFTVDLEVEIKEPAGPAITPARDLAGEKRTVDSLGPAETETPAIKSARIK